MAALRISLEAGRSESRAAMGGAAPAAAGLADVVRRAWDLPAQSMVRQLARASAPQRPRRDAAAGAQSVSRHSTSIRSREIVRVPFCIGGGTPRDRRLVETRRTRRISAARFSGKFSAPVSYQAQPPRGPDCGAGVASPGTGSWSLWRKTVSSAQPLTRAITMSSKTRRAIDEQFPEAWNNRKSAPPLRSAGAPWIGPQQLRHVQYRERSGHVACSGTPHRPRLHRGRSRRTTGLSLSGKTSDCRFSPFQWPRRPSHADRTFHRDQKRHRSPVELVRQLRWRFRPDRKRKRRCSEGQQTGTFAFRRRAYALLCRILAWLRTTPGLSPRCARVAWLHPDAVLESAAVLRRGEDWHGGDRSALMVLL